jgi:photosystem II stability/assembly factor-like uncharacterized protein
MRSPFMVFALIVVAAAFPGRAEAQGGGWRQVYDRAPANITTIEMFDGEFGLAIAAPGILRTVDGGRTWTEPAGRPLVAMGAIGIADAQHAWTVGTSGSIWRTDDGGLTWGTQASGTAAHLGDIAVVSASEAWVTGSGEGFSDVGPFAHQASVLLHTTDAGTTWQSVAMTDYGTFRAIEYRNGRLWLTASQCREGDPFNSYPGDPDQRPPCRDEYVLLRSDDGGASWHRLGETSALITRPQFLTRDDGFGIGSICDNASLCRTSYFASDDGGESWLERGPSPAGAENSSPHFVDSGHAWAALADYATGGYSTTFYRSDDGGRSWQAVTSTPRSDAGVYAYAFDDTPTGLVAAGGASGIASWDAATGVWTDATADARPTLSGITFRDEDYGIALSDGAPAMSADGGATWLRRPGPVSFAALSAGVDGALWASPTCTADPCPRSVYRSIDGGASWEPKAAPGDSTGLIAAGDAMRAWISLTGGLWRTDDGGETWQIVDAAPFGSSAAFFDRDHGWTSQCGASQCEHAIRVTEDGGDTWETRPLPPDAEGVAFTTAAIGTARGYSPGATDSSQDRLLVTTDGGRTWADRGPQPFYFSNPHFVDARRGWMLATDFYDYMSGAPQPSSRIVATEDGGVSWRDEFAPPSNGYGVFASSAGRIWFLSGAFTNPWGPGRTTIYSRDIGAAAAITAPDTGAGQPSGAGEAWMALALLTGGFFLLVGLASHRPRGAPSGSHQSVQRG